MNERIKELAVKAKVEHCISHVRLQEFAELIVKECVREFVRKLPVSVNVSNRATHVFKHFGVKE